MNIAKRIMGGVALAMLWAAAAVVLLIPGCQVLDEHETAARLIARGAVLAYIEQAPRESRGAVALKVLEVSREVRAAAGDGEPITLQRLAAIAAQRLPADMPPARRLLALEVIAAVQEALQARTGVGGIESDSLLRLGQVLGWVDGVAAFYVPAGAT
jgi:hypothetical protein